MCKGTLFVGLVFCVIFKYLDRHLSACLAIASKVSGFPVHAANAQAKPQRSSWRKQQKSAWKNCKQQNSGIFMHFPQQQNIWDAQWRFPGFPVATSTIQWVNRKLMSLTRTVFSQVEALAHRAPARYRTPWVPVISAWNCWKTFFRHVCKQRSTTHMIVIDI